MPRYFFDLESDGFLDVVSTVHSLVLKDADVGTVHSLYGKYVEEGVYQLQDADEIIGHNIIKFDVPVLSKLFPSFDPKCKVTDTLVLSRLLYPNLAEVDMADIQKLRASYPKFPVGSHSLKAWGIRLGVLKGDFGENNDWEFWSAEMQSYCEQDVEVTETLYKHLMSKKPSEKAVEIEHRFATILAMQERHGFTFNEVAAAKLYSELVGIRLQIADELQRVFPPKLVETVFIPKVNNAARGYVKGIPFTKQELVPFNPSSRQMIGERLVAKGWKPIELTPSGQPKVDETILSSLPYPEAQVLARHFLVEKRIGQIAEGDQAWLKLVKKGRIHGAVNPNGAVTGRCTHSQPNLAQVPSVKKSKEKGILFGEEGGWGAECRGLFTVRPGYSLVGADLAGLELRCLAHFMAPYDGGKYADVLLTGDIHAMNQEAAGLPTRDNAKTFIYAFLYGAGDAKIGSIVAPDATEEHQAKIGKKLKKEFLKKTPALADLKDAINNTASPYVFGTTGRMANPNFRPFLLGLDRRKLHVRSAHSALNVLLQSAGALISKVATIITYDDLTAQGLVWGKDFAQVAHVHDEMQYEVRKGLEEQVGNAVVNAMRKAGEYFNFKCPIDGEFKFGSNWKETH